MSIVKIAPSQAIIRFLGITWLAALPLLFAFIFIISSFSLFFSPLVFSLLILIFRNKTNSLKDFGALFGVLAYLIPASLGAYFLYSGWYQPHQDMTNSVIPVAIILMNLPGILVAAFAGYKSGNLSARQNSEQLDVHEVQKKPIGKNWKSKQS